MPVEIYVRDYGEEKVIDLVHYRREHKQLEATGTEDAEPKFARGYLKKLAIRERISNS